MKITQQQHFQNVQTGKFRIRAQQNISILLKRNHEASPPIFSSDRLRLPGLTCCQFQQLFSLGPSHNVPTLPFGLTEIFEMFTGSKVMNEWIKCLGVSACLGSEEKRQSSSWVLKVSHLSSVEQKTSVFRYQFILITYFPLRF